MRILNLGSLNYDKVYGVEHFVLEGETISSTTYAEFFGGKGLNQSLASAIAVSKMGRQLLSLCGKKCRHFVVMLYDSGFYRQVNNNWKTGKTMQP